MPAFTNNGISYPLDTERPYTVRDINLLAAGIDYHSQHAMLCDNAAGGATGVSNTSYAVLSGGIGVTDIVAGLIGATAANATIIQVGFVSQWKAFSGSGNFSAAIFINGTQLKTINASGAPINQEVILAFDAASAAYQMLTTGKSGLVGTASAAPDSQTIVTTGMPIYSTSAPGGGLCTILMSDIPTIVPGITVDIRYKVSAGSITIQQRRLWARVISVA